MRAELLQMKFLFLSIHYLTAFIGHSIHLRSEISPLICAFNCVQSIILSFAITGIELQPIRWRLIRRSSSLTILNGFSLVHYITSGNDGREGGKYKNEKMDFNTG